MISDKQLKILAYPYSGYRALICDGAVRSGKTSLMVWAFVDWAMRNFSGQRFGICGKTVDSATKNICIPFMSMSLARQRYSIRWRRSDKIMEIRQGTRVNYFEVFGGKDEGSFALIQGRTLAGVLLDEVVLMPESFVNQALARCSVDGAKLWFNCNPGNPGHWFYNDWIKKHNEHNALYLHFTMQDNPSLSADTLALYESMYSGNRVFYDRYVRGLWVAAEGLVYPMFSAENLYTDADRPPALRNEGARVISCDYGTVNPTVFLDIYDYKGYIWIDREYRWDSRKEMRQKTDEEYADDMLQFIGERPCMLLVDPSAASFIEALRRRGLYVQQAENDVLDGIRRMGVLIQQRKLRVNRSCEGFTKEIDEYVWDEKSTITGEDKPVKASDHDMDACRYYCNSLPDWRFE